MQNKANFRKVKLNVNNVITMDYENKTLGQSGKNKANSKPNKAKSKKAKMNVNNVNKVLTRDYENMSNWAICENKANTNPIQSQTKPTCSELVEPISKAKKYCSPPLCCGISKEKMIFCNLINKKSHFERAW